MRSAVDAAATWVERTVAIAVLLAIPVIAPMSNLHFAGAAVPGNLVLLGAGFLLAWILAARLTGPVGAWLARRGEMFRFDGVLIAGVALQVLVAIVTAPVPVSDFLHYSYLAERIASGSTYVDELGRRASLPPGWPFVLAPFMWTFGPGLAATIVVNVLLYLLGATGIWSMARRLFGAPSAVVATALFTFWPARALMAGLAAKENLLITAVIAGTALAFKALDVSARHRIPPALAAGGAFGLAALTQPGVLVLLPALPLMYRSALATLGRRRYMAVVAAIATGAALTIAPWMLRNCAVFDGQFCGISTNGGSVFDRVNNPDASGLYMSGRGTPLEGLSELERDRRGYELGRQWIRAHPLDAAKLSLRKWRAYLGGDDHGAYWGVLRGAGGNEADAVASASLGRMAL
jgi:hypothetical protein